MIFRELMESGGSEEIDHDDSEILHNVLELSNKRVKETMVPRTDIVAVERDSSLADLKKAFIESGYSKIPVYRDSIEIGRASCRKECKHRGGKWSEYRIRKKCV